MTAYSSQGLESYSPLFLGSQCSGFASGTATQVYVYMYGNLRPGNVNAGPSCSLNPLIRFNLSTSAEF